MHEPLALYKTVQSSTSNTCWIFAGFAVRAGQPDGFDVLTQCKGCEFGLDVQVLMADSAKILDLNDELLWNAVETRLSHHFVFAVSVWLPSVVTFGDLRLHSVGVPDVHGKGWPVAGTESQGPHGYAGRVP